jgi:hypothetical protein
MYNPEQDQLNREVQQALPQELDPAFQEMYERLANPDVVAQPLQAAPEAPIVDLQEQANQQAIDIEDKRHLVEDAFAATAVYVPAGEKLTLGGQQQKGTKETLLQEAAKSQPIPDEANQGRKKLLHKMGSHVRKRADKLGIRSRFSARQQEQDALVRLRSGSEAGIATEAGGVKELDITQNSRQEWVENKLVGEELIRGLATPERMTAEMRQQMTDLWQNDPAEAQKIWQGVQHYRETGNITRITAHDTGKATEKLAA